MSESPNITSRLFRNASWLFAGKTFASVCFSVQTILLARVLGVADYGLMTLVIAYVSIVGNLFDWKMWETATKYIGTFWASGEKDKAASMIKLSYLLDISSGIVGFCVVVLTSELAVTYILKSPGIQNLVWIYSLSLLILMVNNTSDAVLRVFERFKVLAFIASFTNIFSLALIAVVLQMDLGIEWVLLSMVASFFGGFVIRIWFVGATLSRNGLGKWWLARLGLIKGQWKEIGWFTVNTSFAGSLKLANDNNLGPLVLGFFSGKEAVAFYKIARSVTRLMTRIIQPVYEVIYPELVKTSADNALRDFKKLIRESTKHMSYVLVPIAAVLIIFPEVVVSLVFGRDYLPAAAALRIVAVAVFITQITFWIVPGLLAFGKPGLRTYSTLTSTIVYVLLLLILVPEHSFIGASWAYLGFAVAGALVSFVSLAASYTERKKRSGVEIVE
ncbi:MAG: oligosaccharide flippase family protein [Thermodesulfobacteriota bacterium]